MDRIVYNNNSNYFLNVAEKPSVAKEVTNILTNSRYTSVNLT